MPFPRITYDDAIELLKKNGFDDIEWGEDFGSPHETFIANSFEQPVFILNYPKAIKPFYMKPHPTREDVVICADMIAPEGYGEIIGGSERATDYDFLLEQIQITVWMKKNIHGTLIYVNTVLFRTLVLV